jgi:hypothetical protein
MELELKPNLDRLLDDMNKTKIYDPVSERERYEWFRGASLARIALELMEGNYRLALDGNPIHFGSYKTAQLFAGVTNGDGSGAGKISETNLGQLQRPHARSLGIPDKVTMTPTIIFALRDQHHLEHEIYGRNISALVGRLSAEKRGEVREIYGRGTATFDGSWLDVDPQSLDFLSDYFKIPLNKLKWFR